MSKKRRSRGNGIIIGRRYHPQYRLCPRCGRVVMNHGTADRSCPVRPEVIEAIQMFRREHGKTWKSQLLRQWEASLCSPELLEARNIIGPTRLYKIDI